MRYPIKIFHSQYKGIWYGYVPLNKEVDGFSGMWILSDSQNGMGIKMEFNADTDRIDQCFELFVQELELAVKQGYVKVDSPLYKPNVYYTVFRDENGNLIDAWDAFKKFAE